MPKIKNEALAGQSIEVLGDLVTLDGAGEAEVTASQADHLAGIPAYALLAEAPKATKKSAAADKE